MLIPKEQPVMELTEQQARNILKEYCDMANEDCVSDCKLAAKPDCCLVDLEWFTTDEVFSAVRELAGG